MVYPYNGSRLDLQQARALLNLSGALAGVPTLPAEASWPELLPAIFAAHLEPTVSAALEGAGLGESLPANVRSELQTARLQTAIASAVQEQALGQILAAFATATIDVRLLKGMALAQRAYGDLSARVVGDLDLWVRPRQVGKAVSVLRDLGFDPAVEFHGRSARFLRAYGEEETWLPSPQAPAAKVDLHWHAAGPWWWRSLVNVPEAAMFNRAVSLPIGSLAVFVLRPGDELLYLCLHAAINHQFSGLRWLVDLARLLKQGVDWRELRRLAVASGTQVLVWRALDLLDTLDPAANYVAQFGWRPAPPRAQVLRRLLPGALVESDQNEVQQSQRIFLLQQALLAPPARLPRAFALLFWPPAAWLRLAPASRPGEPILRARLRYLRRALQR